MGGCTSTEEREAYEREIQNLKEENARLEKELAAADGILKFNEEVAANVNIMFQEITLSKQRKVKTQPVLDAAEKRLFREVARKLGSTTNEHVSQLWKQAQEPELSDAEFMICLQELAKAVITQDILLDIVSGTKQCWRSKDNDVVTEPEFYEIVFRCIAGSALETLQTIKGKITEQYTERSMSVDGGAQISPRPPIKRPPTIVASSTQVLASVAHPKPPIPSFGEGHQPSGSPDQKRNPEVSFEEERWQPKPDAPPMC